MTGEVKPPSWPVPMVRTMAVEEAEDDVAGAEDGEGEEDEGEEGEGEEGEEVDPVEEVADSARSDEERLAAARRAWDREQASGCAITVDHVHTGRCLAAVKRHRSYRKEGASTFAAWTQQHMGIGRFMARFYVMAGAVTLKAVRRRVLSVEKLALLSEVPPGLQPELARLGERLSRQRLRVVVKAATASLARSPDQRAALCAAVAVAEEQEDADAVCAAPVCAELMPEVEQRLEAAPSRGAVESARARACECVRALQRELMALQGLAQVAAQVAAPLARIDAQQRQLGEELGALRAALAGLSRLNISGEKDNDSVGIAKRGAPQTAGLEAGAAQQEDDGEGRAVGGTPADEAPGEVEGTLDETESEAQGEAPDDEEDRGLDDEKGRGLDDGEDDQEDAGALAPTDRAPAPVCVTTQELARALLAGLAEAEQAQLSNAFLGVLSRHNEPWARRSRRFLTMAVQQAQRSGHMQPLVGTAFLGMLDGSAAHFKSVFGTFLELSALPCFRKDLRLLCQGELSPDERAQVRAQAAKLPRPTITDPVAHRAAVWKAHDELVARLPPPEL